MPHGRERVCQVLALAAPLAGSRSRTRGPEYRFHQCRESDPVPAGTKLIAETWGAVRRFVKSDNDTVLTFGCRRFGSPDLYAHKDRAPEQSINFITSHDGFTLNNCGVEGPTDDPEIERLRHRQVKNFLAITLLSLGTPILVMDDEMRRTQLGNHNAYCQDNESAGSTGRSSTGTPMSTAS